MLPVASRAPAASSPSGQRRNVGRFAVGNRRWVTPVLAMCTPVERHRRTVGRCVTPPEAVDRASPFAADQRLIEVMPNATEHVFDPRRGQPTGPGQVRMLGLPSDADVYLCGPGTFMDAMRAGPEPPDSVP